MRDIYFATGKTQILSSSETALAELYNLLRARPKQRIRIIGHTDDIGSDRANQTLSEGRCQSVRQEMINRGIAEDRIDIEGRGEKDPIVPNDSDEHRQMNRRVEIVLL
jgi:outer membrane protein OmpA-like peptidoglycan-associated protein